MSAAFTPSVNVALAVEESALTVTVYVVDALAPDGVPVIAPVEVFNDNPAGRDGDIEYVLELPPPDAVIGVNDVAAVPEVSDLVETDVVAESGVTTKLKLSKIIVSCVPPVPSELNPRPIFLIGLPSGKLT